MDPAVSRQSVYWTNGGGHGTNWQTPVTKGTRTLAQSLRDRGYVTGGFVANLMFTSYESGLQAGFDHYDDYRVSLPLILSHAPLSRLDVKSTLPLARTAGDIWPALSGSRITLWPPAPSDVRRPADEVASAFLDWQLHEAGRPFFAFLNLMDAHDPYFAPPGFAGRFGRAGVPLNRYDASIAWLDHVLAGLFKTMADRGILDETVVVITSDHGEQFGEHGLDGHANSLYIQALAVPLVIRYPPAIPAGKRVDTVISLRDLPATILDLVGVRDAGIDGVAFSPAWRGEAGPIHGDVIAELIQGWNSPGPPPECTRRHGRSPH